MTQDFSDEEESKHGFWSLKRPKMADGPKKVLVAHTDNATGESIAVLLALKGFSSMYVPDIEAAHLLMSRWIPDAILIDTRLENGFEYDFTHAVLQHADRQHVFLLAMADFAWCEPTLTIRDAGYDAMCRRPCPFWKLTDLLNQFFAPRWQHPDSR